MKGCENTRQQDSVIAKLMGFDDVSRPRHQPVREKRRLLSESYIRKADSIGVRHGSLVSNHIYSTRVQISNVKKGKRSPKPNGASVSKSLLSRASDEDRRSCGKKDEHCVRRHVLRYLQKLEHDIDDTKKSLDSQLEMIDKPCTFSTGVSAFKPNSVKVLDEHFISGNRELEEFLSPDSGKHRHKLTYKQLVENGSVSTKHSCIACTRTMNRIYRQEQGRSKFREVSKPGYMGDNQLTEKPQEVRVYGRRQTVDEMLNLADEKSCAGYNKLKEQTVSHDECVGDVAYASAESFNGGVCSRINGGPHSKSNLDMEDLSEEASLDEFSDEFEDNLKRRTSQHSPDSVLKLCDVQNSSTFEYFDRIGLQLQLQALNIESEETYSEGSVMAVSDDEDISEEQFDDLSHDGRKIKRWLGDDQSRNFSYMIDVLNEAVLFYGTKSLMDLKYPISPSVFEDLEETYGKQTSWLKSERRLLFDRIDSALDSYLCSTSVRRRFCATLKRCQVEDEVWGLLISQENGTSKDLSEKDLEKRLDFEEGVDIVCTEMETSLFDDLVMELVSSWD